MDIAKCLLVVALAASLAVAHAQFSATVTAVPGSQALAAIDDFIRACH